jgi:regulator of protease activity HflC (stomatin/prohibitin superfamily)
MANTGQDKKRKNATLALRSIFLRLGAKIKQGGRWVWKRKIPIVFTAAGAAMVLWVAGMVQSGELLVTIIPGERGIVFNHFGGGISDDILHEGTHLCLPGLQTVYRAKVARQSAKMEKIYADSKEFQDVTLWINVEFQLTEKKLASLFREYGVVSSAQIIQEIIWPNVNEVTKNIVVDYPISTVLLKQPEIKGKIVKTLADTLRRYYIELIDVDIVNILINQAYRDAIAQTELAVYQRDQESIRLEAAKKEAERRLLEAQTRKQEKILEAEGIAEYNRLTSSQRVSASMLEYKRLENQHAAIEKWDGKLPAPNAFSGIINGLRGALE